MANTPETLKDKVMLVTGGTGGIGAETAKGLAAQGAAVVIVGRSPERTQAAAEGIAKAAGAGQVIPLAADLSIQAEVHGLARRMIERFDRLDVLVNNAGIYLTRREVSKDGLEMNLALNHLGYYLLTRLLLERLVHTADMAGEARVINVSSDAHRRSKINIDQLRRRKGFSQGMAGFEAYGQSKLANVLFTYELARRLEGSGVTSNALHPGFVASNFGKNNGFWMKWIMSLVGKMGVSSEEGAQTSIYLAAAPEVRGLTGMYFVDCRPVRSSQVSYNEEAARGLWEISAEMTGLPVSLS